MQSSQNLMYLFVEEGPDSMPQSQEKSRVQGPRREGATDQHTDILSEGQHSGLAAGWAWPRPGSVEGSDQALKARAGQAKGQSVPWGKMAPRILLEKLLLSSYNPGFSSDPLPIAQRLSLQLQPASSNGLCTLTVQTPNPCAAACCMCNTGQAVLTVPGPQFLHL